MRSPSGGTAWRTAIALAAICALALSLRLVGIDRELPHLREPDAYVVCKLQAFVGDDSVALHQNFEDRYPSFLASLLALLPYPEVPARATGPGCEAVHLATASWPFLVVRTTAAIASTLFVLLTWLLARRFLTPGGALLAAFFVATSLLSILFAQQGRPHAVQAAFALLAVLLALRVRERPSLERIVPAVLAAAAAAATLQNGLFAVLPLAVGAFLGRRERAAGTLLGRRAAVAGSASRAGSAPIAASGVWRRLLGSVLIAVLAVFAALALAAPFYPQLPYWDEQGIHLAPAEGGGHTVMFSRMSFLGPRIAAELLWDHDPILATLAAAGAILGIERLARGFRAIPRGRRFDLLVLAAYALPYAAAVCANDEIYERFLLPLLPYLACLAALAFLWVAAQLRERLRDGWARASTGALAGVVFLGFPLAIALRYARAAAADDTLEQAAAWIRANVEPGRKVLVSPGTALPLLYDLESVGVDNADPAGQSLPWVRYQALLPIANLGVPRFRIELFPALMAIPIHGPDPERMEIYIRDSRADYVVFEISKKMRRSHIVRSLMYASAKHGDLVYRSRGHAPSLPGQGPIDYQGVEDLALRLLETDAFGPGVVIYRIRR